MILTIKDSRGQLLAKDILDIDFDMSVSRVGEEYILNLNQNYIFSENFGSREEAEEQMMRIVDSRNSIEAKLYSEL